LAPPPRLHVLLRPGSPRALVVRRGPSKTTCTIDWDLARDAFTVGQWCRHKIYPQRCDLSADGRWLSYFALNGRWRSETKGAWAAVSRAPYLKAVLLWPVGNTWGGGGRFVGPAEGYLVDEHVGFLFGATYQDKLRRDGWVKGKSAFEKGLGHAWILRKRPRNETQGDAHQLVAPDGAIHDRVGWEWADVDEPRRRVVWAEAGAIHAAPIGGDGLGSARLLFDARPMKFEPIAAPYNAEPTRFWR
jgi:hypothetical protein